MSELVREGVRAHEVHQVRTLGPEATAGSRRKHDKVCRWKQRPRTEVQRQFRVLHISHAQGNHESVRALIAKDSEGRRVSGARRTEGMWHYVRDERRNRWAESCC